MQRQMKEERRELELRLPGLVPREERRDVWEREAVGPHKCFVGAKAENRGLLALECPAGEGLLVSPAETRSTEGPDVAGRLIDLV